MRGLPFMIFALAFAPGCTCERLPESLAITAPFGDSFDRATLGSDYLATAPEAYRIEDGALVVRESHNHPLWLQRRLPRNAVIEFDCWSASPDGDIKIEAWGDGRSHATGDLAAAYTSTAYNFIFGGWRNTVSTIARMHEHGGDRHSRRDPRVIPGQKYHWTITRQNGRIDWRIDGQPFLIFDDAAPLEGERHAYFGFTNWEAELHFDNLRITPLP